MKAIAPTGSEEIIGRTIFSPLSGWRPSIGGTSLGAGKKSSKQKTAERYIADGAEIEIISEGDFLELLGEG